ncbi:hypothetical protein GCM10009131_22600 [Morganella psychrotolerans]
MAERPDQYGAAASWQYGEMILNPACRFLYCSDNADIMTNNQNHAFTFNSYYKFIITTKHIKTKYNKKL